MTAALQEFIERIHQATRTRTPVHLRGGGSKDFYGDGPVCTPSSELGWAQVLDTRSWQGIISYEPSELVVTARCGTPLAQLEDTLAQAGQCLAFEPPHFATTTHTSSTATVGGMVAAGLSGPARAAVGAVRDFVLGATLINGRGELLSFGGQVMKNVAGYDVSRLMVGSLGALGLITQVSLKVLPLAPAQATLRFELDEASALAHCARWAAQPLPLNASVWQRQGAQSYLTLRLRGAQAAVRAAQARLLNEAPGEPVPEAEGAAFWHGARNHSLPWFTQGAARGDDLWRLSLPPTTAALGRGDTLIDWLGAQRWVWLAPQDSAAAQRLRAQAHAAHGHAQLFRPGQAQTAPAHGRFDALSAPVLAIHQRLKAEFDPAGIFNPARLHAAL